MIFIVVVKVNLAIAFKTVYFENQNPQQAIDEISLYFTGVVNNCKLEKLSFPESTTSTTEFYNLSCNGNNFFIKKLDAYNNDYTIIVDFLLQNQMTAPSNLSIPLDKWIFNKNRYLVYQFIKGNTLTTMIENIRDESCAKKLPIIYAQLGKEIAKFHLCGLTKVSNYFCDLTSNLIHNDLHSSNIIIKKENGYPIIIDIEEGFYSSLMQPKLIVKDINTIILQTLPTIVLMIENSDLNHVIMHIYNCIIEFIVNYSAEFFLETNINFNQQIKNYILQRIINQYQYMNEIDLIKDIEDGANLINIETLNQRIAILSDLIDKKQINLN